MAQNMDDEMPEPGEFSRNADLFRWFDPEADAELRDAFASGDAPYRLLQPELERFARDLIANADGLEATVPNLERVREAEPSIDVGAVIAYGLSGGMQADVSRSMCEHLLEVALHLDHFAEGFVIDVVIARGVSRMMRALPKVLSLAVADNRRLDQRFVAALEALPIETLIDIWASRRSLQPGEDRVFTPAEQYLLRGECPAEINGRADVNNSNRQKTFQARKAFWAKYQCAA